MKKFLAVFAALTLSANTFALAPEDTKHLPSDAALYYAMNLSKAEGQLKELIGNGLEFLYGLTPEENILPQMMAENRITFSLSDVITEDFIGSVEATKDEYTSLSESLMSEMFWTHLNNIAFFSTKAENISPKMDQTNPLSENANFQEAIATIDPESLIFAFITPKVLGNEEDLAELTEYLPGALAFDYQAISLNQTSTGLELHSLTKVQEEFENTQNETRDLYKLLPANRTIMAGNSLNSMNNSMVISDKLFAELEAEGFPIEVRQFIDSASEYAFVLQNNGHLLPELTVLVQMEGSTAVLEKHIDDLATLLKDMESEKVKITHTEKAIRNQSNALHVLNFQFAQPANVNPYAPKFSAEMLNLTLTMGVTDKGVVLLSTNPEIFTQYSEGNTHAEKYDFYLSKEQATDYLYDSMTTLEKTAGMPLDFHYEIEMLKTILAPWGDIKATRDLSAYPLVEETLAIDLDFDEAVNIYSTLGTEMSSYNFEDKMEYVFRDASSYTFPDVSSDLWYADGAHYLNAIGVFSDYDAFDASTNINRGEAVLWLIKVLEFKNRIKVENFYISPFNDDYYSSAWNNEIGAASQAGIIKGYADGSFKPQNPISRAEFAVLLGRIANQYVLISQNPSTANFPDVQATDWFYNDVQTAFNLGLMRGDGNGNFRPQDPINRAEAAIVVKRLAELMN